MSGVSQSKYASGVCVCTLTATGHMTNASSSAFLKVCSVTYYFTQQITTVPGFSLNVGLLQEATNSKLASTCLRPGYLVH